MKKPILVCLIFSFFYMGSSWGAPIQVAVSVIPQRYFVKAIGGNQVSIQVIVPPGFDPATYAPTPRQLLSLEKTKLYFAIGVPFESVWLSRFKANNPNLKIIDTQTIADNSQPTIQFAKLRNPHIWLSPPLVRLQIIKILDALMANDPSHTQYFLKRYGKFAITIDHLDQKIIHLLDTEKLKRRTFMIYHPALFYFANAYGLKEIPIEKKGKSPNLKSLSELLIKAKLDHIKTIFVEPQFNEQPGETLAHELNAKIVTINPLAENWPQEMLVIAKQIKLALSK